MALEKYIGVMSGTSMDGVDAVLLQVDTDSQRFQTLALHSEEIPTALKHTLRTLAQSELVDFNTLCSADQDFGGLIANTVNHLLDKTRLSPTDICAIGSHGQTIRHKPDSRPRYSVQIGNPNVIAELTHIDVVADFRMADMVAAGQGAPLVPAFHLAAFGSSKSFRAIINIGGIANLTLLNNKGSVLSGYDIGPGNTLLDAWTRKELGQAYDEQGAWARSGSVLEPLLNDLLAYHYFRQRPPKSTGPELFNLQWLASVHPDIHNDQAADIQRTLTELTAITIAHEINTLSEKLGAAPEIYFCGGGVHNAFLMECMRKKLAPYHVETTEALGIAPQMVEGAAFAWLAMQTIKHLPGNCPSATGARHPKILGGIYLAT